MKGTINLPDEYFLKYKDRPVKLIPFDPKTKKIGLKMVDNIKEMLGEFPCEVLLRGSTLYEISGKGDIEIGIYVDKKEWENVFEILKEKFGEPGVVEEEYVRFNLDSSGQEFEIMMFTGRGGLVDKKLTEYLKERPELLREYEEVKKKYTYSKIDYNREKNRFLRRVEAEIPEEYNDGL